MTRWVMEMVDTPVLVTPPPVSPPPAAGPAPRYRPLRSRYILVVFLPLAALIAAVVSTFAVNDTVNAKFDSFPRAEIPGQATVWIHPGTWYIYATTGSTINSIQVTDPSGQALPVKASSAGSITGARGGRDFHAVGQFTAKVGQVGDARVTVAGADTVGGGSFAVGDFNIQSYQGPRFWVLRALLVVNIGAAIAIVVVPIVRARRLSRGQA